MADSNDDADDPRIRVWFELEEMIDSGNIPTDKRRHHFVPVMYQRRFARDNRLATINLKSNPPTKGENSPLNIAVRRDLYRLDLAKPGFENVNEEAWAKIEKAALFAFRNLDAAPHEMFDEIDRFNLSIFIALQVQRGPDMLGAFASSFGTRMLEALAADQSRLRRYYSPAAGMADAEIEALQLEVAGVAKDPVMRARAVPEAITKAELSKRLLKGLARAAEGVMERHWQILHTPIPLLSGDCPVVTAVDPANDRPDFDSVDQFVFPLGRNIMLTMTRRDHGGSDMVALAHPDHVRAVNRQILSLADQWVFYHPDDNPLEGIDLAEIRRASKSNPD
ncbi:MAG: DUF4238 domain-containing protein [Deltaproteobacteria bacterium]|nr:DUF4238 domain-containing protein [Deltaproteobacteria bacterium]